MSKILIDETTVKLVLEALHVLLTEPSTFMAANKAESLLLQAAPVLRKALADQPAQQGPVAYFNPQVKGGFYWAKPTKITAPVTVSVEPMPLYTTPQAQPDREPLTLDQIGSIIEACEKNVKGEFLVKFARAIEAKIKEKNS